LSSSLYSYGFAEFAKPVQFRTYVDYVIRPSYDLHKAMGLLQYTISGQKLKEDMSFRNFFSGRILWDEAMASAAIAWTTANPGGLMIGLVGADHVKFQGGIPGRYARMAGSSRDCISVILNPTLIDTSPPGTVGSIANSDSSQNPDRIILQLRYLKDDVDRMSPDRVLPASTGGVMALADYIIVM
jgi:Haem-binding uptake, Tiki superfamily, ChaN